MIDVNNESGIEVDSQRMVRLAKFVLRQMRIHVQSDLSILLVDEATMAGYNERFMGHAGPTDVLSFPMDELRAPNPDEPAPRGLLGDIVLCPTVTSAQAAANGRAPLDESDYLLVHGILHLLGYDHAEPAEKQLMFALNDRLIADWMQQ